MVYIITKFRDSSFSQSEVKVQDPKSRPKKPSRIGLETNLFTVFPSRTAYFKNSFFIIDKTDSDDTKMISENNSGLQNLRRCVRTYVELLLRASL